MTSILGLDAACDVSQAAPALVQAGYQFVGRYVVNPADTHLPGKALLKPEAQALSDAGLKIVSIYETNPTHAGYFTEAQGGIDNGKAARVLERISPTETPIYFTVDYDADPGVVLPYFRGIEQYTDLPVGVYGSGAVCQALLDAGLVTYTWLAQSEGWSGFAAFKPHATIIQHGQILIPNSHLFYIPTDFGDLTCDPDTAQVPDYGFWQLPSSTPTLPETSV